MPALRSLNSLVYLVLNKNEAVDMMCSTRTHFESIGVVDSFCLRKGPVFFFFFPWVVGGKSRIAMFSASLLSTDSDSAIICCVAERIVTWSTVYQDFTSYI